MKKAISILTAAVLAVTATGAAIAPAMAQTKMDTYRNNEQQTHKFWRHGNQAYYNGYLGVPYFRPGWRYYEGFWFPPAAFVIGSFIAGAIIHDILHHLR